MPAGLLSNSLQVGGLTMSIFLHAVDGGVDLVAISGGDGLGRAGIGTGRQFNFHPLHARRHREGRDLAGLRYDL